MAEVGAGDKKAKIDGLKSGDRFDGGARAADVVAEAVLLQYYCSIVAVLLEYYCSIIAVLLQHYCSNIAVLLQYYCNNTAIILQYYCSITAGTDSE